jgi:hypothetical protein
VVSFSDAGCENILLLAFLEKENGLTAQNREHEELIVSFCRAFRTPTTQN